MATLRREVRIQRSASEVWNVVGDPGTIQNWFPGITASTIETTDDGVVRTVTLATGVPLVEHVVTNDPIARRFQYSITGGLFREHLGTIDVIDLGDETSLVVYGTDATPDVLALVLGGACGAAIESLKSLIEADAELGSNGPTPNEPTPNQPSSNEPSSNEPSSNEPSSNEGATR